MTAINNDQRILDLKKQIKLKKETLGKSKRFSPITNCSLDLDGERYSIQALNKQQLILLLVKLSSYLTSAKELNVHNALIISGYSIADWIEDISSMIDILNRREEEKSLKLMEEKLTKLLSEKKKVELEIDEIESLLNN